MARSTSFPMLVLYITYDGLTDPLGRSQVIPYLTQLAKLGYQFTILSFEKQDRLQKEGADVAALLHASGIQWVPLVFSSRPPILSKVWDRFQMRRKAFQLYRKCRFQLVHCRSYIAAEVGLALKERYGVKMLFDMRGFWADEKVDNGQWNLSRFFYKNLYRYYKHKEQQILLSASAVVCLTKMAKDILLAQEQYCHLQVSVIPCCADLEHFDFHKQDKQDVNLLRKQLPFAPHHKVLVYLGSVGGWYMTGEMFEFFRLLHQSNNEYRMLVLTKDDVHAVKSEAIAAGIDPAHVVVTYASRELLPQYLALCTASVFFIRPSYSKQASSPTKHAELMGMGLPVICNDIGDTGSIIAATQTGYVVKGFDETSLMEAAAAMPGIEQIDPSYIRSQAFAYFNLEEGVRRYAALYESLLGVPVTQSRFTTA